MCIRDRLLNGSKSVSTEESTLAWYQKLDENADAYPVLKSTDHNTCLLYTSHDYANHDVGEKYWSKNTGRWWRRNPI